MRRAEVMLESVPPVAPRFHPPDFQEFWKGSLRPGLGQTRPRWVQHAVIRRDHPPVPAERFVCRPVGWPVFLAHGREQVRVVMDEYRTGVPSPKMSTGPVVQVHPTCPELRFPQQPRVGLALRVRIWILNGASNQGEPAAQPLGRVPEPGIGHLGRVTKDDGPVHGVSRPISLLPPGEASG